MSASLTARTREIVYGRSLGICEVCGRARAAEASHRRPQGMGGTSSRERQQPAWILHLCSRCHHTEVESHRQHALDMGWLLRPVDDALLVPAKLQTVYGSGWWLLDNEGGHRLVASVVEAATVDDLVQKVADLLYSST